MKDLSCVPEEYQRLEWRRDALVKYRPWWVGASRTVRRQDAYTNPALPPNEEDGPGVIYMPPKIPGGDVDSADRDALCAAYDEANPLLFPGFRVGQIWGVEWDLGEWDLGEFIVSDPLTKAAIQSAAPKPPVEHGMYNYAPKSVPNFARLFGLGNNGFGIGGAHEDFNRRNVFLLVDPLCPSAAPWSGVIPPNALDKVPR